MDVLNEFRKVPPLRFCARRRVLNHLASDFLNDLAECLFLEILMKRRLAVPGCSSHYSDQSPVRCVLLERADLLVGTDEHRKRMFLVRTYGFDPGDGAFFCALIAKYHRWTHLSSSARSRLL